MYLSLINIVNKYLVFETVIKIKGKDCLCKVNIEVFGLVKSDYIFLYVKPVNLK